MGELLRVLQIEDSASDAALIVRVLRKAQYDVKPARVENAEQMRAALLERTWDVIIADYHLPRFSAPAALRILHESGMDIPFIVVSGRIGEDTAVEVMKAGAHDYVLKSSLARLAPAVERELGDARARLERRQADQALRESEQREKTRAAELQAIMDAMPVAMFVSRDPECRRIIGNRATYELLRLPPGSNLSKSAPDGEKPTTFRAIKDGHEMPPHELPVQKAAFAGKAVQNFEFDLLFEDGTRRNMIGNAVPFLDAGGRSWGAVGVFIDITERKQAEERLRHSQKLESVGLLAGGVAHDFNNLLTVIMGSASAALLDCPACQACKDVISASERAAYLAKQLLAYAGKGQFVNRTFNISELVSRAKSLLASSVPKRVTLSYDLPDEELLVNAGYSQMEQILMNLVINAGEAIPPKIDGRVEITTSSCEVTPEMARTLAPEFPDVRPGQFVCLEVRDNGAGIDEATRPRIFDPFFTTKFTGRGLGLAAVHGIVRGMKGFIDLRSARGTGATFRVFVPTAQERFPAELPIIEPVLPKEPETAAATVLVVDDEDMVRKLACMALRSRGYEVLEADHGKHALDVLAGAPKRPALMLVDLAMPVMGGDELIPIVAREYPDAKIVATSGYSEDEARKGFSFCAVAGFLQKPYTVIQLADKVREVLSGGQNLPV